MKDDTLEIAAPLLFSQVKLELDRRQVEYIKTAWEEGQVVYLTLYPHSLPKKFCSHCGAKIE